MRHFSGKGRAFVLWWILLLYDHYFQLPSYHWAVSPLLDCTNPPGQRCSSSQKFTEPNTVGLILTNLQMSNRLHWDSGDSVQEECVVCFDCNTSLYMNSWRTKPWGHSIWEEWIGRFRNSYYISKYSIVSWGWSSCLYLFSLHTELKAKGLQLDTFFLPTGTCGVWSWRPYICFIIRLTPLGQLVH